MGTGKMNSLWKISVSCRGAVVGLSGPMLVLACMVFALAARGQACGLVVHPVAPTPAGFPFAAIAVNPEEVVAVTADGVAAISRDGATWQIQPMGTSTPIQEIAWGNGQFLATATSPGSAVLESEDGVHWEASSPNISAGIQCLTFANGWFYGVSGDNFAASRDGRAWTLRPCVQAPSIRAITYAQGRFVAVGYQGALETSTDGYSWVEGSLPSTATFSSVTYGGGRFVAVGDGGVPTVLTSTDGLSWEPANYPSDFTGISVAYGNGRFVAQSWSPHFIVSTDGVDWQEIRSPTYGLGSSCGLVAAFGAFVALGQDGILRSDADGMNWTALDGRIGGPELAAVTTGGSPPELVAVGYAGKVMESSDAETWTTTAGAQTQGWLEGVAYGAGQYVAVGTGTYIGSGDTIFTSKDGDKWSQETPPIPGPLRAVAYGGGTFVAVGETGLIFTSEDGKTWTWQDPGYRQDLYGVAYGGGRFVAVGAAATILTSQDGATWTPAAAPVGTDVELGGVAFGAGHFVVTIYGWQGLLVSDDGQSWQVEAESLLHTSYPVYAMGRFMVTCLQPNGSAALAFSEDGLQWVTVPWDLPSLIVSWTPWGNSLVGVGSVENYLTAIFRADGCFPLLSACDPARGSSAGGDSVVLTGTDLDQAVIAVYFGNTPAASFTVDSPAQITAVSPPHEPATVSLKTELADGSTADQGSVTYTYTPAHPVPQIVRIKMGGNPYKMVVRGTNFMPDAQVYIDAIPVPQTVYKSQRTLVAKGGDALKAMLPKEFQAAVIVRNVGDWTVSLPRMVVRR